MREPAQQLVATVMVDNCLNDDPAERRHPRDEPWRYIAAMQRQISAAGSVCHDRSIRYFSAAREALTMALVNRANIGICKRVCCQYNGTDSNRPGTSSTNDPSRRCDATSACGFIPQPIPATLASVKACVEGSQCAGTSISRLQIARTHCACRRSLGLNFRLGAAASAAAVTPSGK